MRQGTEMSKVVQQALSGVHLNDPRKDPAIIACIGEEDDLELRIQQASDFAWVPSCFWGDRVTIIFWAAKWDDLGWKALAKDGYLFRPFMDVTLKLVGEDPIDPSVRAEQHMYDNFFNSSTHDGYKVKL
jgi:hypothetical protein